MSSHYNTVGKKQEENSDKMSKPVIVNNRVAKKKQGVKLGRPKGAGKSKLDPYRPEIEALLKNGSTQK